jgi:hypothetical protein
MVFISSTGSGSPSTGALVLSATPATLAAELMVVDDYNHLTTHGPSGNLF